MAAERWIMVNLTTHKIEHIGICMVEHLDQVPCPAGYTVVISATGMTGQYWDGTTPQDDPIIPDP